MQYRLYDKNSFRTKLPLFYGGYMEASCLAFKLDKTASCRAHIEKHLREKVLEVAVMDGARGIEAMEFHIREVERGAELVGRRIRSVDVDPAQAPHTRSRAQQRRDFYAVSVGPARSEGVDEVAAYVFKQPRRLRDEKRQRMRQRIHLIKVTGGDVPQRPARVVGEIEVGDRFDAEAFGIGILELVAVVEHLTQMPYGVHMYAVMVARALLYVVVVRGSGYARVFLRDTCGRIGIRLVGT